MCVDTGAPRELAGRIRFRTLPFGYSWFPIILAICRGGILLLLWGNTSRSKYTFLCVCAQRSREPSGSGPAAWKLFVEILHYAEWGGRRERGECNAPKIPEWGFGRAMKPWALGRGRIWCWLPAPKAACRMRGPAEDTHWQAKQEHNPAVLEKP